MLSLEKQGLQLKAFVFIPSSTDKKKLKVQLYQTN